MGLQLNNLIYLDFYFSAFSTILKHSPIMQIDVSDSLSISGKISQLPQKTLILKKFMIFRISSDAALFASNVNN